jgi:hypothetical protein
MKFMRSDLCDWLLREIGIGCGFLQIFAITGEDITD